MAEHTPGPWVARDCELIGDSTVIATLHWHSGRGNQNDADARLIASAPDMLNALKAALAVLITADDEKIPRLAERLRRVESAIAKAEGRP